MTEDSLPPFRNGSFVVSHGKKILSITPVTTTSGSPGLVIALLPVGHPLESTSFEVDLDKIRLADIVRYVKESSRLLSPSATSTLQSREAAHGLPLPHPIQINLTFTLLKVYRLLLRYLQSGLETLVLLSKPRETGMPAAVPICCLMFIGAPCRRKDSKKTREIENSHSVASPQSPVPNPGSEAWPPLPFAEPEIHSALRDQNVLILNEVGTGPTEERVYLHRDEYDVERAYHLMESTPPIEPRGGNGILRGWTIHASRSDWPIDIQLQDLSTAQDSAVDVQLIIAKNNREFIKAGGIGIILAVMKRHERRANIQEQGCRVLAEMAYSLPTYGTMVLSLADDATIVQVILSCMLNHEDKAGVQEQGCRALAELAAKLNWRRYIIWARDIVDVSFMYSIVSAMRQHEDIASVQEEACRVLNFFSSSENIADLMDASGALDVISAALRNHPDNNRIRVSASEALLHLARTDGNRELTINPVDVWILGVVIFNILTSARLHHPLYYGLTNDEINQMYNKGDSIHNLILRIQGLQPDAKDLLEQRMKWLPDDCIRPNEIFAHRWVTAGGGE